MIRGTRVLALLALALVLSALPALGDARGVTPGAPGPNRLDPDAALLARAQPARYAGDATTFLGGLDDLRLYDARRTEVPYLLVPPEPAHDSWIAARLLPVAPTKKTSGFEADFGSLRLLDRIRFDSITTPYLKRLRLEGSGDRQHYAVLAADATVFDLPDEKLRNREVAFEAGEYRYLRVTWDDRSSAVVNDVGVVTARLHRSGTVTAPMSVAIAFHKLAAEAGTSRYRLPLPGSHLPLAAIALRVANRDVLRDATVEEPRLTGSEIVPVPLGSSQLRKTSRGDVSASELSVPILFPEGDELELVVRDGSNPPLAIDGIDAVFAPLPWIYFESADGRPLTATYGDRSLHAPSYDLEAARNALDRVRPAKAVWAAAAVSPAPAAEMPAAVTRGARVERKEFRFARTIPQSSGITRLQLDAEVLAHSRDLADARIVDGRGEQVPYLVERMSEPLVLSVPVPKAVEREGRSIYTIALPYDSLPPETKLVFTTTLHVFTRDTALLQPLENQRAEYATLASVTWQSGTPDLAPPPLTFDVPLRGVRAVELRVDEGDNAPLPIATARLLVPAAALRFYATGAPLTLLYGKPDASAPRYDLALLASRILAAPAHDLSLGSAPRPKPQEASRNLSFFWIAIAAVVLVLLVLLARLLPGHVAA